MNSKVPAPPQNKRFILSAVAVVLVLCAAPIGSYLFLKGGFQYRLESLQQLEPKQIPSDLLAYVSEYAPFRGNARLIYIPGTDEENEREVVEDIDQQITDRSRFDIISFGQDFYREKHKIDLVNAPGFKSDLQFILMDTSDVIRGVYPYHKDLGKELIRHLSVVIPMPAQKSITLNRDKQ